MVRAIAVVAALMVSLSCIAQASAADVLLPQQRGTFFSSEEIEIAVAGLDKGAKAAVEIAPKDANLTGVKFEVTGDGGTVNTVLPPNTLAKGEYIILLDGKDTPAKFVVAHGVWNSNYLASVTYGMADLKKSHSNFVIGNMAGAGMLDGQGQPLVDVRRPHSYAGAYENAMANEMPTVVYMYWTGYVTHKPWGSKKSWENGDMTQAMRLFNFRAGQFARRYSQNIALFGTLDEPGLNWGKNPNGMWVGGVANWDGAPWYKARGWEYTNDPASRDDADWMKYMTIRNAIIGEQQAQARKDLEVVWPKVPFAADIYAVHIVTDGADAMNQVPNTVPTTHVFLDWGVPRVATSTELYIEKSHDPVAPIAHAMNGRLFGGPVPTERSVAMYQAMQNSMFQAGLYSNWYLNPTDMKAEDLAPVHERSVRLGSLLRQAAPSKHEIAVLWSFTELCMREKAIVAQQAKMKGDSQPIKLMISALPENTAFDKQELDINTYSVAGNYRNGISHAHAAIMRAGYPAHVVHENALDKLLDNYKVLVIVGQTFELPKALQDRIAKWQAAGGQIVVDGSTTVKFKDAIVMDHAFRDIGYAWVTLWGEAAKIARKPDGTWENKSSFKSTKDASQYLTNFFMASFTRDGVKPVKAALAKSKAAAVLETDEVNLIAERHFSGDASIYLVLNANDVLPEISDDQAYSIYNYAPLKATYALKGIAANSAVYCIEGVNWDKVSLVKEFDKPIAADFAAGEMKMYLVLPKAPGALETSAKVVGGQIEVTASVKDFKAPLPLTVTVTAPNGTPLFEVYRALNSEGTYTERFPIGSNAPAGEYKVGLATVIGDQKAGTSVAYKADVKAPAALADAARVFDEKAIAAMLASKDGLTIAINGDKYKAVADALAKDLAAKGVKATVADEKTLLKAVAYPRVWNPYAVMFKAQGDAKEPAGEVKTTLIVETSDDGVIVAKTEDGKEFAGKWNTPLTKLTVGEKGLLLWEARDDEEIYEAGCVLYFNDKGRMEVLKGTREEVDATPELRAKWSKPPKRFTVYHGGYSLLAEVPHAFACDQNLIVLGDSTTSELVKILQAGEMLMQVVDAKYPGAGKSLLQMAWSPFAVERNVIFVGATDEEGIKAGAAKLTSLMK